MYAKNCIFISLIVSLEMVKKILLLTGLILALSGCGRMQNRKGYIHREADSLYTPRAAMKVYGKDPERALLIVDSALTAGKRPPTPPGTV